MVIPIYRSFIFLLMCSRVILEFLSTWLLFTMLLLGLRLIILLSIPLRIFFVFFRIGA